MNKKIERKEMERNETNKWVIWWSYRQCEANYKTERKFVGLFIELEEYHCIEDAVTEFEC